MNNKTTKKAPVDFIDYYEILSIPPDADKKLIQKTFRQLARKFHPDVNPGNKEAEENFKIINEANQVLSDEKQRKKYDKLRAEYQHWQQMGNQQQDFDWQNWSNQPSQEEYNYYASAEDLEDLFGNASPYSDFFTNNFSQAYRSSSRRNSTPSPRRGRDIEYEVELNLEEAFHGGERLLEIDKHRIKAKIPPGVRTGSRIRLAGQAEPGQNGGSAGDLYLIIHVNPNETFEREGDNLHLVVPVDIFTAIAGGEVRIPAIGRPLNLKIPPRTNANRIFRIRGKGMPHLRDPKIRGDLFARVILVLPESLSDQEVSSIRDLEVSRSNRSEVKPDEVKV